MYEIRRFWLEWRKWPIDTPEWIFLGKAVHMIGKGLFHEDWNRNEPMTWACSDPESLRPFPSSPKFATSGEIRRADRTLREVRPELATTPDPCLAFTADEWLAARTEIERERDVQRNCFRRFGEVADAIRSEAIAGRLVTGHRAKGGGDFTSMPAAWWNTEKLRPRFAWCKMKPTKPFGDGVGGYGYCWIFIRADSLDRFIKALKSRPTSSGKAYKRARQYLEPIMMKAKPADITREGIIKRCAKTLGIGASGARQAYEDMLPSADQSWRKMGRPRKTVR